MRVHSRPATSDEYETNLDEQLIVTLFIFSVAVIYAIYSACKSKLKVIKLE